MNASRSLLTVWVAVGFLAGNASAAVDIETVPVGNRGNAGDTRYAMPGYGSVSYEYRIGKHEVTVAQYCGFLNAVAAVTDPHGLFSAVGMADHFTGDDYFVTRTGSQGSYTYAPSSHEFANRPVNFVTWANAARFCNWLTNGQSTGGQHLGTTEDGSYLLNGAMSDDQLLAVSRKPNARYVIPNENEWYKAAYHKNDGATGNYWTYPTSGDAINPSMSNYNWFLGHTMDVGSYQYRSPYGTCDQGGNVFEWLETTPDGFLFRGGQFNSPASDLSAADRRIGGSAPAFYGGGFRIAYVPEPATLPLLLFGLCFWRRLTRGQASK